MSATVIVNNYVAQEVPAPLPSEIAPPSKVATPTVGEVVRMCGERDASGSSNLSDDLCAAAERLMASGAPASTPIGEVSGEADSSGEAAIDEAIRNGKDDVQAGPLSAGPNGGTRQS